MKCWPKVTHGEAHACQSGVLATAFLRESLSPVPGRRGGSRLNLGVRVLTVRSG